MPRILTAFIRRYYTTILQSVKNAAGPPCPYAPASFLMPLTEFCDCACSHARRDLGGGNEVGLRLFDYARACRCPAGIDLRRNADPRLITGGNICDKCLNSIVLNEVDGAAAKACACEP